MTKQTTPKKRPRKPDPHFAPERKKRKPTKRLRRSLLKEFNED